MKCGTKNNKNNIHDMSIFAGKTLMITGGTGSFGNAVLNRFLRTDIGEIRIFSRDEKKQDDMRHEYQVKYPDVAHKINFLSGMCATFSRVAMRCLALTISSMRRRLSRCRVASFSRWRQLRPM